MEKPNNGMGDKIVKAFTRDYPVYWANLSRLTNLLIILNISMFFVTELVTTAGYYYTFYSLFFLFLVFISLLLPLGLMDRLWYYAVFLIFESVGVFFLVSSVVYWVKMNR